MNKRVKNIKKIKVFFIIAAAAVVFVLHEYKHTFTVEKWLNSDIRVDMVDDMLEKYDLHGLTKKEIISLLGDETQDAYFKEDNNMVYWLGPERGLISIDSEWLVIVFENGIVADYYITCD